MLNNVWVKNTYEEPADAGEHVAGEMERSVVEWRDSGVLRISTGEFLSKEPVETGVVDLGGAATVAASFFFFLFFLSFSLSFLFFPCFTGSSSTSGTMPVGGHDKTVPVTHYVTKEQMFVNMHCLLGM